MMLLTKRSIIRIPKKCISLQLHTGAMIKSSPETHLRAFLGGHRGTRRLVSGGSVRLNRLNLHNFSETVRDIHIYSAFGLRTARAEPRRMSASLRLTFHEMRDSETRTEGEEDKKRSHFNSDKKERKKEIMSYRVTSLRQTETVKLKSVPPRSSNSKCVPPQAGVR